jgi:hypothetical protein
MHESVQPLISLAALERAFSPQRLLAYRDPADRDAADGVARYLWNLALVGAMQPVLHTLEVTFRNEVHRAAAKITATRGFAHDRIPSWLDAKPTMLMEHEQRKVENAKDLLGSDARSQTEGHLIAKLDFGFWVALCRHSYDDWRSSGPRLWPRALEYSFRWRPAHITTRSQLHRRFDAIRDFRNRVAHHEPIWDRDYLNQHEYIIESLSWMSPKLAGAVRVMSSAAAVYNEGPAAFRARAVQLIGAPQVMIVE